MDYPKTLLEFQARFPDEEACWQAIKDTLARGEPVKISGSGRFAVRRKSARWGRNPQTGGALLIEARRVVTFRPSQSLKELLNDADAS